MNKTLFFLFFISTLTLRAQQPRIYNQFFMNPYLYNPAYAGVEGHSVLFFMYRQQWTNIDGAPKTIHATYHTPLAGGIGFGVYAFNQSENFLSTTLGKVSGSYLLTIDRQHYLRFGMSIGAGNNSLSFGEIDAPDDRAFSSIVDQSSFMVGDFGATYHFGHFNVGFSLPNLFSYDLIAEESFAPVRVTPIDEVLFKINYRGHLNDDIAIEPHLIYRYNKFIPDQIEATMIAHIFHVTWAGLTYRQDNDLIALVGAKVKESLAIGYAYQLGNSNISNLLGPTHEIHIGYHLGSRKRHAEHVSSFIKSHRLSPEERAKKAELERQRKILALQESRPDEPAKDDDALTIAQPTTEEPSTSENEPTTNNTDDPEDKTESSPTQTAEDPIENPETVNDNPEIEDPETTNDNLEVEDPETANDTPEAEDPTISEIPSDNLVANTSEPVEPVVSSPAEVEAEKAKGDPGLTQDFRTHEELAGSDQHMEAKRGSHLLELPAGNHVIAGAFESFERAENFSDALFERGFRDVIVGYLSARGYYYVVISSSNNVSTAVSEKNRIKGLRGLSKVWVLKVNE
ncbi:MAG: PorP/SprF family type IX secretion system membrane protein [Cyclobacteriaceae bacterium]|nr:PorP/SprF family type IX secretion system membrane protein [Cyclobacteriaceae bacterium HetDA_MAG_MS6]